MSCCTVYYDYGCLGSCGTLSTGYTATVTGTFTVVVEGSYAFDVSGTIGEELEIDLSNFNEEGMAKWQIYTPTGTLVELTEDEVDYTCFKAKIGIQYNVTTTASDNTPCCDDPLIILVPSDTLFYTIQSSQWAGYGAIPTIEVYVDPDGTGYTQIQVSAVYTGFPTPTSITVTIPGAVDSWYIKIS